MAIKSTDPPEYDFFTVCCACGAEHPMEKRRKGLPKPFYECPVCFHAMCGACEQRAVNKGGPDQKASPPSGEFTMDSIKKRILEMEDELRREEDEAKRKALREALQRKSKKEWDYPLRGWPETNEPRKKRRKPSDEGGGRRKEPAEDGVGRSIRIIQRGLRDELLSD